MASEDRNLGLGFGSEEDEHRELTPWEQHSSIISIPRFDYNAPQALLDHSHCGFLITCPIKREKSATKEAISILSKFITSLQGVTSESSESLVADITAKRRKICSEKVDSKQINDAENDQKTEDAVVSEENCSVSTKTDMNVEKSLLSLVKLTRSGLLLFTFPRNSSPDTVDIVSDIFHSVELGKLKSLSWCHRIFPIQATCRLDEENLRVVVRNLVQRFLDKKQKKFESPIKFAVGYDRRGVDEKEMKIRKCDSQSSESSALLDRNKCFTIVAGVVKEIISDSVVDLKSPELVVLIELLPLSGISNGLPVVAVSVLPCNLVRTKPRLCIKPLISDSKTSKGQS
ncbi:hypothetical protein Scep_016080 [Stephania cephalantha]|uniref:THUMP domain-containing protein n=1 Tax=Stephania cephalantha TaxID=152367 RepID=A0AAP0IM66_9MAGN